MPTGKEGVEEEKERDTIGLPMGATGKGQVGRWKRPKGRHGIGDGQESW